LRSRACGRSLCKQLRGTGHEAGQTDEGEAIHKVLLLLSLASPSQTRGRMRSHDSAEPQLARVMTFCCPLVMSSMTTLRLVGSHRISRSDSSICSTGQLRLITGDGLMQDLAFGELAHMHSICNWFLSGVDHKHLDPLFPGFQLQSKLFLNRGKQRSIR
ncbi:MAG: hypothetical protein JWN34_6273, partial [Bryobacterales bacterium]|nr:hypothetical protein [Bryobacterales bacterium]